MRPGHADAQFMFERIAQMSGFEFQKAWTRELPTDGVWIVPGSAFAGTDLPVAALEVVVTEGPKSLKGSIDTLAEVSPALGVVVIHEEEIRRGLVRRGVTSEAIERKLAGQFEMARDRVKRHQQRIEVWSYAQLRRRYELVTGDSSPVLFKRTSSTRTRTATR